MGRLMTPDWQIGRATDGRATDQPANRATTERTTSTDWHYGRRPADGQTNQPDRSGDCQQNAGPPTTDPPAAGTRPTGETHARASGAYRQCHSPEQVCEGENNLSIDGAVGRATERAIEQSISSRAADLSTDPTPAGHRSADQSGESD